MRIARRSRRLSSQTIPDPSIPLDQRAPGSFDYVDLPDPAVEPPIDYPAPVAKPLGPPPPPLSIKELCAFIDLLEVGPPDQHFQPGRRKGKNGNASRPPNAFLLFRSHFWRYHKEKTLVRDHREISRMAAICWRSIDESKQVPYKKLAKQLKDEHAQLYPQHKYNLSAKERSARGKNKTGGDELCYVVAAQVAQDARASESPQTPELSEGGVLGAPAVVTVKKASKSKPRPFQPSVKRGKRNLHKPSVAAIPVSVTRVQTDHSLLVGPPFAPNSEIPHLTHPPSSIPPEVNFLDIAAGFVSFQKEPTQPPSPTLTPVVMQSPGFIPSDQPEQYCPEDPKDPVVAAGLRLNRAYGLVDPAQEPDYSTFMGEGHVCETYDVCICMRKDEEISSMFSDDLRY